MRTSGRVPTAVRRALWAGGVLVVLAGVFGMHGLSTHGVDAIAPTLTSGPAAHAIGTEARAMSAMVPSAASELVTAVVDLGHHGPIEMSGAAMCLAILLGSLIALLLRYRRDRTSGLWFVTSPSLPVVVRHARSPDPPCLIALSVQRC